MGFLPVVVESNLYAVYPTIWYNLTDKGELNSNRSEVSALACSDIDVIS